MQRTANLNATQKAKELLNFLSETAGKAVITGQHTQTHPMEEIDYIYKETQKKPLLRGFEMLAYSPNINYQNATKECLTEIYENRHTMETALNWAKGNSGIVTLSFHWFSPIGGHDKSFYAKNTDFDATHILIDGTPERLAFYHDMDVIAVELKKFLDADIPVLWRPFHESDGCWFWWGAKGSETARELYKLCSITLQRYTIWTIFFGFGTAVLQRVIPVMNMWILSLWTFIWRNMRKQIIVKTTINS